jgi:RND superfamily putative drug exporter
MGAAWAHRVVRRPRTAIAVGLVLLGAMTVPAFSLQTALTDDGNEPRSAATRQVYDTISRDFGPGANGPLVALVTARDAASVERAAAAATKRVAATPGVTDGGVVVVAADGRAARFVVLPSTGPKDPATKDLVARLQAGARAPAPPAGATVAITGQTAVDIDVGAKLSSALIPFGVVVIGLSLVLLLVAFRSVAIPIKAAVGFLLSIGASFGATVAVFQWGWLSGLLGVTVEGPVASFMPIVVMAVLFGLAMDYEVFMVSAMREAYAERRDARRAIVVGSAHASRVVTAAALIMVAVFGSFLMSPEVDIKPIAWALAIGVLVDAFVVRMTLVPAALALLGDRAWWVPAWLDRVLPHVDLEGGGGSPAGPQPATGPGTAGTASPTAGAGSPGGAAVATTVVPPAAEASAPHPAAGSVDAGR